MPLTAKFALAGLLIAISPQAAGADTLEVKLIEVNDEAQFRAYAPMEALTGSKVVSKGAAQIIDAGTAVRANAELPDPIMLTGSDGQAHAFVVVEAQSAASDSYSVRATFMVTNRLSSVLRFRVGDIACRDVTGKPIAPTAVGRGSALFTKLSTAEQQAVADVTGQRSPGISMLITYQFSSKKSALPLQWSYRGQGWSGFEVSQEQLRN